MQRQTDIHTSRTWSGPINKTRPYGFSLPSPPPPSPSHPSSLSSNSGRPVGFLDSWVAVKMPTPVVVKGKAISPASLSHLPVKGNPHRTPPGFPARPTSIMGGDADACACTRPLAPDTNGCLLSSPRMQWQKPTSRVDRELPPAGPYYLCLAEHSVAFPSLTFARPVRPGFYPTQRPPPRETD